MQPVPSFQNMSFTTFLNLKKSLAVGSLWVFLLGQAGHTFAMPPKSSAKNLGQTPLVATINIRGLGISDLNSLKHNKAFTWWSEFGDTLVVGGEENQFQTARVTFENIWKSLSEKNLRVIIAGHQNELPSLTKVITRSGRTTLVIQNEALAAMEKVPQNSLLHDHFLVRKFLPNKVYVQSSDHDESPVEWSAQQSIKGHAAMQAVDGARWYSSIDKLSSWNRHISSPEIILARDWLTEQFESLHPTSTRIEKFSASGRDAWNVITTFDAGPNSDVYIIGGHYDSISEKVSLAAPGAEDNASGAAGVLELARIFAGQKNKATMIFIAFSGEEQGLLGSYAYVASSTAEFKARIKSVMTMDMIGYSKDATTDVLLETAQEFRSLTAQYAAAARQVDGLTSFTSFNPWGSDHMPFIEKHIPAMLTIDNDWGDYPPYHRTNDTIDQVSREMGVAILKMNAAFIGAMQGQ
jgi:hypothetical protein